LRFDAERAPLVLAAAFLALALVGIGAAEITGDDESREVGIVQDVLAGHWLWPRFNDELIPDKPVLTHWLAAIPCAVAGFSEGAVRFPSAVAGAFVVGWTAWFGIRALGVAPGVAAALLLATFPAFFERARLARPDMVMLALLAPALGLAFRAWRERRRRDAVVALALVGLATFAKGPVAPALFATTVLGFLAWQRDLRRVTDFLTPAAVAAFVVLGLGWYAIALAGWGDEFVRQHIVGRYLRNLAGGIVEGHEYSPEPLWYHLTFYPFHLLAIALPWTPLIALALVGIGRRNAFSSPLVRFLVCWTLAPVVVFTPAEWKLRYYLLPSLPALALLAAPLAADLATRPFGRPRPTPASLALAAGALLLGGAAVWVMLARPDWLSRSDQARIAEFLAAVPGHAATGALAGGLIVGMVGATVALRLWGPLLGLVGALAVGWFVIGGPAVDAAAPGDASLRTLAREAATRFRAPAPLAFYGPTVRSIVVYAGRSIPSLDRDDGRITPGLGLLVRTGAYERLAAAGLVGERLAVGEGQIGNLDRGTLVLTTGRRKIP
jgi:4-amino-4-deoxy-L-arabinose transferase-like glycosyltransferase